MAWALMGPELRPGPQVVDYDPGAQSWSSVAILAQGISCCAMFLLMGGQLA